MKAKAKNNHAVKNAANTKKRATSASWKPGQSGNPKGRPRDGESWAAILTWASNLTGEEAAARVPPEMAKFFRPLKDVKLKEAISLRVMASLLFEPSSALFNAVMDRVEGKVLQPIAQMTWREYLEQQGLDAATAFNRLVEAAAAAKHAAAGAGGTGSAGSVEGSGEGSADSAANDRN
jgi:hypothetical protein